MIPSSSPRDRLRLAETAARTVHEALPQATAGAVRALVVLGTRPEAIKLAPVLRAMHASPAFEEIVVSTGQHREMLDQMLTRLDLRVHRDLAVMRDRQRLSSLTARLIEGLGEQVRETAPDVVVVQGDTTSAFCGALAAFYEGVPVAHVEAGLRTGVLADPFPEELNRRLVAPMTRWHFAPTSAAARNLTGEGISAEQVHVVGNPVIDNLFWTLEQDQGRSAFSFDPAASRRRRILVTLHRRENQGEVMAGIARALRRLALRDDVEILLPMHLSPAVRDVLTPLLSGLPRLRLIEPLDYFDFAATLNAADLVLTDSGGVQEEAPSLGKPVLVLRRTTERPEAIDAGVAALIGTAPRDIYQAAVRLLDDAEHYAAMANAVNPFGDGHAAARIVDRLARDLATPLRHASSS